MPQTNYMPLYSASYPLLAKVQKPGGVVVSTTVGAGDVPNKPTYLAGTIQAMSELQSVVKGGGTVVEESVDEAEPEVEEEVVDETEEVEHDENGHPKPRRSAPHHRKKSRR